MTVRELLESLREHMAEIHRLRAERNALRAERDALLALIVDDGFAASFQTMAQYRSALLNSVKGESNG